MTIENINAIRNRLFIRLDDREASPLLSLDEAPKNCGTVISVGPDVQSVAIGDKVMFHLYDELPTFDKNVVVILESSLLGMFNK